MNDGGEFAGLELAEQFARVVFERTSGHGVLSASF
jgi:hypothetical protein